HRWSEHYAVTRRPLLFRQRLPRQADLDRPLQFPELDLDVGQRIGDTLDLLGSKLAAEWLVRPDTHSVHIDQASVRIEIPPNAMGQPIPVIAKRERLVEISYDGFDFRQAAWVLALIFGAELSELLGPLLGRANEGFSEPGIERDRVGQLG